jgi:hypothetical protein
MAPAEAAYFDRQQRSSGSFAQLLPQTQMNNLLRNISQIFRPSP